MLDASKKNPPIVMLSPKINMTIGGADLSVNALYPTTVSQKAAKAATNGCKIMTPDTRVPWSVEVMWPLTRGTNEFRPRISFRNLKESFATEPTKGGPPELLDLHLLRKDSKKPGSARTAALSLSATILGVASVSIRNRVTGIRIFGHYITGPSPPESDATPGTAMNKAAGT